MSFIKLWVTNLKGDYSKAKSQGCPADCLTQAMKALGGKEINQKEMVWEWWENVRKVFRTKLKKEHVTSFLLVHAQTLGEMLQNIIADNYAQRSRARWPCTFKTLLRILCGILAMWLYGGRLGLHALLIAGHVGLHYSAATFVENKGWPGGAHLGLDLYLDMTEKAVFEMPEWDLDECADIGFTYTRFNIQHDKPYKGMDEIPVYAFATQTPLCPIVLGFGVVAKISRSCA